ncbi:MAG TPA: phospho-N-acetylmuramoyl-pentapeptide-transferase [Candidatus Paceibacterota bacterium]|nr:phospho-N-acetylmuramoyl-pentapeptide-transferase [Candidatus Paceibacterota bacterium]HOL53803.1 phospho-N-acetylmuramoyl-pentapeptide-transferase [Candidatus Paceibacterota bacterium]HON21567.1 phospho-N-acetylmuramoyl-pentapeptide-transferase [Candidatus Paceibacterota bacterium]HPP16944.1 phospho-N-acetylmuramoyl-pentapeptide-transferase [Candidatus Paceibacterota bacterium]HRU33440.1 phospho-N-acetylmuramoyl-pentapeptide-transferase [Candidatus Paceibacterota bacterium]
MSFELIILQLSRLFILSTVSFILSLLLTPVLLKILSKYNVGKQIRIEGAPIFASFHQKKEGTPTMGGILIWLTTAIIAFTVFILSKIFDQVFDYFNFVSRSQTYLPLFSLIGAALIGLADDIFGVLKRGPKGGGLSVRQKLVLYFIIALVGASWFYFKLNWDVVHIPFLGDISLGPWYILFFIFVVVGTAHATNLTDGLDGLAGGVMLFAYLAMAVVAFVQGRFDLATFIGVILGALLAFLWFNIHPARFFMGDTGSMALGITLGVLAMYTNTAFLLPFFAFIPLVETLSVIVQLISKKFRKKKVFLSSPIHHHFEAIGWPEEKITMRFWIISAISTVFGLVIFFIDKIL